MIKVILCDDDMDYMDKEIKQLKSVFENETKCLESVEFICYHSGKELFDNYEKDNADIFFWV